MTGRLCTTALLAAALLVVSCHADDIVATAKAAGANMFVDIIKAAGAADAYSKHSNTMGMGIALIAPIDKAVDAWMKSSGLGMGSLAERKALAQRVVGYATLFPTTDLSKLKPGSSVVVPTANPDWNVTVTAGKDGKLTAADSHGMTSELKATASPNVFTSSMVLLPGNVFHGLNSMGFMMHGDMMRPFTLWDAAVARAKWMADLKSMGATVFTPTDDAFRAAGLTKEAIAKADPAALRDVLSYHTISGYKPIPKGFVSGKPVPTLLKGASLTVITKEERMGGGYMMGHATVKDEAGNVAAVVAPNQFSGHTTIHAIDKVLSPKPKGMAPAAAKMGADAMMAAAPKMGMGSAAPQMGMASATSKMGMGVVMAAAPKGGNRRLLQFRTSAVDASSFASNNARDAILSAVNSDAPNSVYRATQLAQLNAQYTAYPTTRTFFLVGQGGGLN